MSNRTLLALAAALALGGPIAARANTAPGSGWSVTATVWGGVSRYDVLGLEHGLGEVGAEERQDVLEGNLDAIGAQALLRLGWLEVGLLYEGTLLDRGADSEIFTPVAGFKIDLTDKLRLDVLGELGGHKITEIGSGSAVVTDTKTVWLPSIGVRPGLSARLPLGPMRFVLAVTPFARWDLVKKEVSVPTSTGTDTRTTYEAGGTTFGVVGGVGFEI